MSAAKINLCVYRGCNNRRKSKNNSVSFFKFPIARPNILSQWIQHCGNKEIYVMDETEIKNRLICDRHFNKSDMYLSGGRSVLRKRAVPIFWKDIKDPLSLSTNPTSTSSSVPGETIPIVPEDDFQVNLTVRSSPSEPMKTYARKRGPSTITDAGIAASQKSSTTDDVDRPDLVFVESLPNDKEDADIKIEIDEPDLESVASLETIMKEEPNIPETTPKEEPVQQPDARHPVQVFFDSMAHTVMGLPPPLAVRAKMEVLQVISKLELEMWEAQAGSSQNQSHKFS